MTTQIRPPGRARRLWARTALALSAATAIALTGLPGIPGLQVEKAEAKPKPKRCDEMYLGHRYGKTPENSGPPMDADYDPFPTDENYTYVNPAKDFDGVLAPTEKQLEAAGKDYRKWQRLWEKNGNPADRVMEMYARYNEQKNKPKGYQNWDEWKQIRWLAPPRQPAPRVRVHAADGQEVQHGRPGLVV